ncbi:SDR family NAD(P)-dependent oxidoreductase [Bacillus sp. 03113]|uniref:SDR family NAD(P)-dependent oxidoreductase n=1 Tax=Bacillus sp. 03113 TaxID=2578211 RepID=UPI001C654E78|nr:SDR family oxidoreductase [Bacillus sp. 03113]
MDRKKVIVITGGNSGIGKAIAKNFSKDSNVIIIGRNEERLIRTAQELGDNVTWLKADISEREQIEKLRAAITEKYNHVDVLVNNAGYIKRTTTDLDLKEAEEAWDSMVDTILKGSYLMSVAIAKYLTRPGGRIINIGSIAGITGGRSPGALGYASAKAGLHGLTYSLARELSPQGITVNAVNPGFIEKTGFTGDWPSDAIQGIIDQVPLNRAGQVEDVASAVRYLASSEASFITGEILNVNGGWVFGRG